MMSQSDHVKRRPHVLDEYYLKSWSTYAAFHRVCQIVFSQISEKLKKKFFFSLFESLFSSYDALRCDAKGAKC